MGQWVRMAMEYKTVIPPDMGLSWYDHYMHVHVIESKLLYMSHQEDVMFIA